ncbi:hypothetical protein NUW54_g6941 [Trametes sanguinea]|uniref:Uncharacterized protein n=1 Tax=Trametes sanguinea TaxID=158606 RepID=A0ACC1PQX5_9APHY|nr:hypothetical protein NUW54_g6941 [Trametes sanguinea]
MLWLLDTTDYRLRSFPSSRSAPRYATLSHRWDAEGEISFSDIQILDRAQAMPGWSKIEHACLVAKERGDCRGSG